jgi:hypothetical protein
MGSHENRWIKLKRKFDIALARGSLGTPLQLWRKNGQHFIVPVNSFSESQPRFVGRQSAPIRKFKRRSIMQQPIIQGRRLV